MDERDRMGSRAGRRAMESTSGTVIRATRRGVLVLETENARRMMRRFRALKPDPEPDPVGRSGTAPARP
jgi:hypothetical protein